MPLRGPNLQVRTCKIQTKLDSKLGPSVAKKENRVIFSSNGLTRGGGVRPQGCFLLVYFGLMGVVLVVTGRKQSQLLVLGTGV